MKTISAFLALVALFIAELAFANSVATTVNGSVQVATGTAAARPLRQGDEVRQGDTVTTGPNSSVVLRFDDGQIAALTSNSRMTVTAYQYNPQQSTGNVLLSLIDGGMRAITGLIGKAAPTRVTYRAATATIGIRGSEVMLATSRGNVVAIVLEDSISFTFNNRTVIVHAGEGVNARTDGSFQQGAAEEVLRGASPDEAGLIGGLQGLTDAINRALANFNGTGNNNNINSNPTPPGGGQPVASPS